MKRPLQKAVTLTCSLVYVLQHSSPEQSIRSGLVAPAMFPEPEDHVDVEPKCQLLLHWAVERIADSVFPELSRKFRNIGKVDRAVGPLSELSQATLAPYGHRAVRETLSYDFGHNVRAPSERPFVLK